MKRKIFCTLLCVMMIALFVVPVSATGSASLVVSKTSVSRDGTITATLKISGIKSFSAGSVRVSYGDALQWTAVESKMSVVTVNSKIAENKAIFYTMKDVVGNGDLLTLTFKVKSNAKFGDTSIAVELEINNQVLKDSINITVVCNHKYSEWKSVGESGHSRSCSICGKKDSGSHVFDHDCDTNCNACGETRETSHVFEEVWVGDETGHWHECVNCKEKTELEAHVPGPEAGEYTDQVCTVCNFVIVPALGHQHRYDTTYQQDEHVHWQLCQGCGEATAQEAHVYDSTCDELCNTCNYQRPVRHNVGEGWDYDENRHWKECEDCHSRLEDGNHIWNGGTVTEQSQLNKAGKIVYTCGVCQQERTGTVPALTFFEVVPWWGWLTAGFGAGTILVVAIGWIVIASKSKSNNKGRFSN